LALEFVQSNPKHIHIIYHGDAIDGSCQIIRDSIHLDTSRFCFQRDCDDFERSTLLDLLDRASGLCFDEYQFRYISHLWKLPFNLLFPMLIIPSDFQDVLFGNKEIHL
jgi:hypothetical protein